MVAKGGKWGIMECRRGCGRRKACQDACVWIQKGLPSSGGSAKKGWSQDESGCVEFEICEHEVKKPIPRVEYQITGQGIQIVKEGFASD
jgi:hypothetical protein